MLNNKLKEVFSLYESRKYKEAIEINNQILKEDPSNIYAKKYASLLSSKLNIQDKKVRVKWKALKCPHCLAKIPFSGLTENQRKSIKSWNYNNLEIKCPYCNTKFVLQKKKSNSILWIKIWDIATIDWKKYRVTWYVEYSWYWYEDNYSGWVKYLEWLLLWKNNEYKYFSEWKNSDDWVWTNEFELSEFYIIKKLIN